MDQMKQPQHSHTRLLALGIPTALFLGEIDALKAMTAELAETPAMADLALNQLALGVMLMATEAARSRGSCPDHVYQDAFEIWQDCQRKSVQHVGEQLAGTDLDEPP